jgi:hypothetical protein
MATVGVVLAIADYLLSERYDSGSLMGIPFALFSGLGTALFIAIAEHLLLDAHRKRIDAKTKATFKPSSIVREDDTSI